MRRARSIWLVAQREMLDRLRSRAFQLSTAVIAVLVVAGVVGSDRLPELLGAGTRQVGVTAQASDFVPALEEAAHALDVEVSFAIVRDQAEGEWLLADGAIDALVLGPGAVAYRSRDLAPVTAVVTTATRSAALPGQLRDLGLSLEQARPLLVPSPPAVRILEPLPERDADSAVLAALSPVVLYIALVLYGSWVLNGVVEEKSNRVAEVLLATLRPTELLTGKVLGIVLVGMAQVTVAAAALVLGLALTGQARAPDVAMPVLAASVLWFLLGLVLYNFAYAALASTVSRQSEANTAAMPITFVLVVPYLLALTVIPNAPDGALARVLSILPPTAPLVMPTRVALGTPSIFEHVAAVALSLPTIAGVIWLAGRIYSGAILRVGRRVGIRDAFRSARETSA